MCVSVTHVWLCSPACTLPYIYVMCIRLFVTQAETGCERLGVDARKTTEPPQRQKGARGGEGTSDNKRKRSKKQQETRSDEENAMNLGEEKLRGLNRSSVACVTDDAELKRRLHSEVCFQAVRAAHTHFLPPSHNLHPRSPPPQRARAPVLLLPTPVPWEHGRVRQRRVRVRVVPPRLCRTHRGAIA